MIGPEVVDYVNRFNNLVKLCGSSLYGCKIWPLRMEDICRLPVFDHTCLRSIFVYFVTNRVSSAEVIRRVVGKDDRLVGGLVKSYRIR